MCIPDALYCAPLSHPTPEDEALCSDAAYSVRSLVTLNIVVASQDPS